jgi:hypothetical protein
MRSAFNLAILLFATASASAACSGSDTSSLGATTNDAGASDATSGDDASTDAAVLNDAGADVDAGPIVVGTVTVDRATTIGAIPSAFVGFSYEKGHLLDGFFTASNAPLVSLFKRIGPSILRVGGNSVDKTEWSTFDGGAPSGDAGPPPVITQAEVDGLAAFAKAADWKVIYAVNMKESTPSVAADEAAYASSALGSALYGFEIGNEVDLYTSTLQSPTWSYATFKTQWENYANAIRARVGATATLTGPASAYKYTAFTVPFASDEAHSIELLTQHYYRASGKDPTSTIDLLLAPDPALIRMLDALAAAAHTNAIPNGYRLAECNSYYGGGAPGVSDAYGTALWAIDFLFTNAIHGASGVNFHTGGSGPGYTPIADAHGAVVEVRPELYGMLLFTLAGQGAIYKTTNDLGASFSAYAVAASDGSTSVVLVNRDRTSTVHASVDAGAKVTTATAMALRGPALEATTGVTLGGASIDPTGAFTPAPDAQLPVAGKIVTVDVPPASALLVHAK